MKRIPWLLALLVIASAFVATSATEGQKKGPEQSPHIVAAGGTAFDSQVV